MPTGAASIHLSDQQMATILLATNVSYIKRFDGNLVTELEFSWINNIEILRRDWANDTN